ncbi:hypothetical protein Hanom_Chr04g00301761 [Helianthus anomalus]
MGRRRNGGPGVQDGDGGVLQRFDGDGGVVAGDGGGRSLLAVKGVGIVKWSPEIS